ncbi:MAG: alpha/beta hydrolase [Pseudomonadota bacterium]
MAANGLDFDGIVLIPGMMSDERAFAPQIASMEQIYALEVLVCDREETMEAAAQRVLNTIPFARAAVVGHSMGGMVAMEMVRQQPGRVSRLALLDTNHQAESDERKTWRRAQMERVAQGKLKQVVQQELLPAYLTAQNLDGNIAQTVSAMANSFNADVFARQAKAVMGRADATATLRAYQGLSLILCGAQDEACPPERHRAMARLIERSELVMVPKAAHFPMLENPEAVTSALEWWLRAG